jgi:hypothetical protein
MFMITGCYFEPEVEAEARAAGATDFVRKPALDVEQLADALRSAAAASPTAEHPQEPDVECGIVAASSVMRDVPGRQDGRDRGAAVGRPPDRRRGRGGDSARGGCRERAAGASDPVSDRAAAGRVSQAARR